MGSASAVLQQEAWLGAQPPTCVVPSAPKAHLLISSSHAPAATPTPSIKSNHLRRRVEQQHEEQQQGAVTQGAARGSRRAATGGAAGAAFASGRRRPRRAQQQRVCLVGQPQHRGCRAGAVGGEMEGSELVGRSQSTGVQAGLSRAQLSSGRCPCRLACACPWPCYPQIPIQYERSPQAGSPAAVRTIFRTERVSVGMYRTIFSLSGTAGAAMK